MKRKIIQKLFIILLLCSSNLFAQTLDEVKKLDTLYFYFSENEFQKKKVYDHSGIITEEIRYIYYKDKKEILALKYSKFKDFEAAEAGNETYKKYHKKRFLKKNKNRLISIDFLNELSSKQRNEFIDFRRRKKNFIIDDKETRKRKVLIRRVFINTPLGTICEDEEIRQLYPKRYLKPFYEESGLNNNFFTFLIPKKKIISATEDLYILFEPSDFAVKEDTYNYVVQQGDTYAAPRVQEQYTFKLRVNNQTIFFQLTHKRKQSQLLEKKYDLFTKSYETVSFEDLNNFTEKQLEDLFTRTRNIYIVENFTENEYVIPLLVKPTSQWVDFVKNNND